MPMSEDLYNRFEKDKSGSSAIPVPAGMVVPEENKKNVNAWHWEEKNCTEWAKVCAVHHRVTEREQHP